MRRSMIVRGVGMMRSFKGEREGRCSTWHACVVCVCVCVLVVVGEEEEGGGEEGKICVKTNRTATAR